MIYKMFHVKHFINNKSKVEIKKSKIKNDFLLVMVDIKGYFKR